MRVCHLCGEKIPEEATFCPFDGSKVELFHTQIALHNSLELIVPGVVIGSSYRVDTWLGEGGMGIVYAVTHTQLNKKFALKLLKRELTQDPEIRTRFLREAQVVGQIHHPNVVEVFDYASLPDGSVYMVMEYLEGKLLAEVLRDEEALSIERVLLLAHDIASALRAAHEAQIVHRDLKPDNIFLVQQSGRESAKILDFGVAKVTGVTKLTKAGIVYGTPYYMSPEQAAGNEADGRTDIYALGVIMYQMLTGKVPFEAENYMGVLTKHMFEPPEPLSQRIAMTNHAFERLVLKALAKKPEDRYQSAEELLQELEQIRSTVNVEFEDVEAEELSGSGIEDATPGTRLHASVSQGSLPTRRRVGYILFSLVFFVAMFVGAWGLWQHLKSKPAANTSTGVNNAETIPLPIQSVSSPQEEPNGAPSLSKAPSVSSAVLPSIASSAAPSYRATTSTYPTASTTLKKKIIKPRAAENTDVEDPWRGK